MNINYKDTLNLEYIVEEILRRNRRYGAVASPNGVPISNVDQYKQTRNRSLLKAGEYDSKLGLTDSIRRNMEDLLSHVMKYYGIDVRKFIYEGGYPTDGSVVYRGHKHADPFSRGSDAKAPDEKAYFTNNAEYAYNIYSVNYNTSSNQIGQSGFNTIQSRLQDPESFRGNGKFDVGFFTIATPKDPDAIKWYYNFGYERSLIDDVANAHLGKSISRDKVKQLQDAECVEPKTSFKKIKTYLIYRGSMVSFDNVKKHAPELYDKIFNSRVVKANDTRVI